jgi:hypothetical protein
VAIWISTDGTSWERVPHDDEVVGASSEQGMVSVTVGGPGLVAVGGFRDRTDGAVVWTSVDGVSWQRVPQGEAVFGGEFPEYGLSMSSVTVGGPGLVAVGSSWSRGTGVVWTSSDGLEWQRLEHDDAVFGTDSGIIVINSVAAGGPGLVAVGWDGGQDAAAFWTSTDGIDWQRIVQLQAVAGGGNPHSVTVTDRGLVAVSSLQYSGVELLERSAAVWTSSDGES